MNVDTGEYVKLNTTMAAEEELRVNTHFANKRVTRIISQTETNAFSTLDSGSTFLQLAVGQNTLRYDADENIDLLEVSIYYRELFLEA
jgi:Phage tail protein.